MPFSLVKPLCSLKPGRSVRVAASSDPAQQMPNIVAVRRHEFIALAAPWRHGRGDCDHILCIRRSTEPPFNVTATAPAVRIGANRDNIGSTRAASFDARA
jgi:hypothetical protein